jgi:hypothetical protein
MSDISLEAIIKSFLNDQYLIQTTSNPKMIINQLNG